MPSNKILTEKKARVEDVAAKLAAAKSIVIVDYKGINVADDTNLRRELREAGVAYSVEKNSIMSYACKKAGYESFLEHLVGTTAVATCDSDEIVAARILQKYSDKGKEKFNLKIGVVDGRLMNPAELKAVATLPDRNTLIAMVCGALNGTVSGLARALSEVAKQKTA